VLFVNITFTVAMTITKNKPVTTFDERQQSVPRRQMVISNSKLNCLGLSYKQLLNVNNDKKLRATDAGEDQTSERFASSK